MKNKIAILAITALLATVLFSEDKPKAPRITSIKHPVPEAVIDALVKVESGGDANAVGDNGNALGILQIWEVVVVDVNDNYGTDYDHEDAFDPAKAKEICRKYLGIYATEKRLGRVPTAEDYARIWNGGPNGHKKSKTDKYWEKVKRALR